MSVFLRHFQLSFLLLLSHGFRKLLFLSVIFSIESYAFFFKTILMISHTDSARLFLQSFLAKITRNKNIGKEWIVRTIMGFDVDKTVL